MKNTQNRLAVLLAIVISCFAAGCSTVKEPADTTAHEKAVNNAKAEVTRVNEAAERARNLAYMQNKSR